MSLAPRLNYDMRQLDRVARDLGASEKQVRAAFRRALSRTGTTLRARARKDLREGLDLRSAKPIRNRLRLIRFKARGGRDLGALRLWMGANDMATSAFKGRATVTPEGVSYRGEVFKRAFIARFNKMNDRRIFQRTGPGRLPIEVAKIEVEEDVKEYAERVAFQQVDDLFMSNFVRELRARTIYKVGRT
jgi:hypothetical protein